MSINNSIYTDTRYCLLLINTKKIYNKYSTSNISHPWIEQASSVTRIHGSDGNVVLFGLQFSCLFSASVQNASRWTPLPRQPWGSVKRDCVKRFTDFNMEDIVVEKSPVWISDILSSFALWSFTVTAVGFDGYSYSIIILECYLSQLVGLCWLCWRCRCLKHANSFSSWWSCYVMQVSC